VQLLHPLDVLSADGQLTGGDGALCRGSPEEGKLPPGRRLGSPSPPGEHEDI
jgi:hypothetical protein